MRHRVSEENELACAMIVCLNIFPTYHCIDMSQSRRNQIAFKKKKKPFLKTWDKSSSLNNGTSVTVVGSQPRTLRLKPLSSESYSTIKSRTKDGPPLSHGDFQIQLISKRQSFYGTKSRNSDGVDHKEMQKSQKARRKATNGKETFGVSISVTFTNEAMSTSR